MTPPDDAYQLRLLRYLSFRLGIAKLTHQGAVINELQELIRNVIDDKLFGDMDLCDYKCLSCQAYFMAAISVTKIDRGNDGEIRVCPYCHSDNWGENMDKMIQAAEEA